jgi:hypothetical protein
LAIVAVVVAGASSCPAVPTCNGDADSKLSFSGKACSDCRVEFGDVDVGLQQHERLDAFWGCGLGAPSFEPPSLADGSAYAIDQQALPQQAGNTGFVDMTFTPQSAGDATDTIDFGGSFKAELHGKGVTP